RAARAKAICRTPDEAQETEVMATIAESFSRPPRSALATPASPRRRARLPHPRPRSPARGDRTRDLPRRLLPPLLQRLASPQGLVCECGARARGVAARERRLDLRQAPLAQADLVAPLHRWSGRLVFALTLPVAYHCIFKLGFQQTDGRVLAHSLLGCAFYSAFAANVLVVRLHRFPNWALPV